MAMGKDNKTFYRGLGLAHPFDDASPYKDYGHGNGMELSNEDDTWQACQAGHGRGKADGMDFYDNLI